MRDAPVFARVVPESLRRVQSALITAPTGRWALDMTHYTA
jgi:hypothetical protein